MPEHYFQIEAEMDEEIALRRTLPIPTPAPETPRQRRRRTARRIHSDAALFSLVAYGIGGGAFVVLRRLTTAHAQPILLGSIGLVAAVLMVLAFMRAIRGAWATPWSPDPATTASALWERLMRLGVANMISSVVWGALALTTLLRS